MLYCLEAAYPTLKKKEKNGMTLQNDEVRGATRVEQAVTSTAHGRSL